MGWKIFEFDFERLKMIVDSLLKKIFLLIISTVFFTANIYSQNDIELNCFTIVVGKDASIDGSTIVAHNEDDFGKQIVNLYKTPALQHANTDIVNLYNNGTVNQVSETNGFIWIELPGMKVADSFINDRGVVIVSNGCPSREENPDSTNGGILYWLRRLVAERANTAKEAVKIAGSLIDKYGYVSPGRTYTFADRNEAWIFCAVYGKHWVSQKVPDSKVVVIPNYYTIGEINLADSANYLGSPDIEDHAVKNGWYNPGGNEKFHFAKAYTALTSIHHPGNIDRIWRGISLLSKNDFPIDKDLPFAFLPYKKLGVQDIKNVLRDHYEECELDKSKMYRNGNPHKKNNATICSGSTQYSFVAQLRQNMPVEISTKIWLTFFRPAVNIYAPIYLGIQDFPKEYSLTDYETGIDLHQNPPASTFAPIDTHAYWNFVKVVEKVDENFMKNYVSIKNQNSFIENEIIRENRIFEDKVLDIYSKNPELARSMISKYSKQSLIKVRQHAENIVSKINAD